MYSTTWHTEGHIILVTLTGTTSLEEVHESDEKIYQMIRNHQNYVHVIIDVSQLDRFPTQLRQIKQSAELYLKLKTMGWVVVVSFNNPVISFLSTVITQVANVNLKQVNNLGEALEYLRHVDKDLSY